MNYIYANNLIFVLLLSTDKTRWLDSLSRQDMEREDEKIYQTWGIYD